MKPKSSELVMCYTHSSLSKVAYDEYHINRNIWVTDIQQNAIE